MKLSIIVPCYNESKNIPLILDKFRSVISRDDVEVLLVNNGSTDGSQMVLADLIPQYAFARVVDVEVNQGYGFGILSGLKEAKGQFIGWTHADMQTDPYDSIKALNIIESNNEQPYLYVKGNRKGRPWFDNFFTIGMSFLETVFMLTPMWDINAQPNIFHRRFFESWENPPHDFSLDLYAFYMARKHKLKIIRFPVFFPPRIHGESSWNTGLAAKWKFIKRTLSFSWNLRKRLS